MQSEHFTQFSHPEIRGVSARIKKAQFCDDGVECANFLTISGATIDVCLARIPDTLMQEHVIYFFTSLKAGTTPKVTMFCFGLMGVRFYSWVSSIGLNNSFRTWGVVVLGTVHGTR